MSSGARSTAATYSRPPISGRLKQIICEVCRSSRLLRQEFPHLKSMLPTLWTNSHFVAAVGGSTLEVVKRYVENQRNA